MTNGSQNRQIYKDKKMNNKKKEIIDKVIKLLDLSNSTNSDNEAEVAKEMAASLMAKYDIKEIESEIEPTFYTSEQQLNRQSHIKYDTTLLQIVSEFNGVAYIMKTRSGQKAKNVFVGSAIDVECNAFMIDILQQQRWSAWKKYRAQLKSEHEIVTTDLDKKKWFMGFAFGIQEKLDNLTEMKEDKIQEHGLVPVDKQKQALSDYEKDHNVESSKSRSSTYNPNGYEAGLDAYIHKGISEPNKGVLLT